MCLFLTVGSGLSYACTWRQGTDAEINFVIRLVFKGQAEVRGNIQTGTWQWRYVDKMGC